MSRVFISPLATPFHSLVSIFPIPSRYISIFRAPPPRYFSPSLSTQQSTAEIEQMILRLQGGVDAAVKAMGSSHHTADGTVNESAQVQQALENILGAVGMIVDQNQQIAAAAEQQTAVAHDIDQNIVEINQAGERTAEGASQTERASRELGAQVTQLKRLIGAFRV